MRRQASARVGSNTFRSTASLTSATPRQSSIAAKEFPGASLLIGLNVDVPDAGDLDPAAYAVGFTPRQAFHFAIFGEKSSLEEIVDPIAEAMHADLYLPTGEISDALIYQIAKDANEDGRPLVLFTLSDCDPSGWQMPVSIARKLQAFKNLEFPNLLFEVVPVAVLPDQVRRYGLPEEPLNPDDKRSDAWKNEHGVDQTEIDCLTTPEMEARGLLREIIEAAFNQYLDHSLDARIRQAEDEWSEAAQQAIDDQANHDRIAEIRDEAERTLDELREAVDRINEDLRHAVEDVTLPPVEVPEPEIDLDSERQALVLLDDDWVTATRKIDPAQVLRQGLHQERRKCWRRNSCRRARSWIDSQPRLLGRRSRVRDLPMAAWAKSSSPTTRAALMPTRRPRTPRLFVQSRFSTACRSM
jgi:hypothetical protein